MAHVYSMLRVHMLRFCRLQTVWSVAVHGRQRHGNHVQCDVWMLRVPQSGVRQRIQQRQGHDH